MARLLDKWRHTNVMMIVIKMSFVKSILCHLCFANYGAHAPLAH